MRPNLAPLHLASLLACAEEKPTESAAPQPALLDEYLLADDAWPESVAFDPNSRAFFTTSLERGDLSRTTAAGNTTVFFAPEDGDAWSTIGLEVDAARRRLWACASTFDGSAQAELWVVDLDTAERIDVADLAAVRAGASCTDVQIDAEGIALVTDRANPVIYEVDLDGGTAEVWLEDPALEPGFVGLNGVVFTPGGDVLVSKYLPIEILRIPRADPTLVAALPLSGDTLAATSGLSGADDLVFSGEVLYISLVDRLFSATSADGWQSGVVTDEGYETAGMTGLTVAEDGLFGSNGQAVEFSLGTTPDTPFWIRKLR